MSAERGRGRWYSTREVSPEAPEAPEARDARWPGIERRLRRLLQTVTRFFFFFLFLLLLSVAVAVMVVAVMMIMVVVVVVVVPRAWASSRHDHAT